MRLLKSSVMKMQRRRSGKAIAITGFSDALEDAKQALKSIPFPNLSDLQPNDLSPKIWTLIDILKRKRREQKSYADFRGMIFVDRRTTASVVSDLVNHLANGLDLDVKCGFVTGHGETGRSNNQKMSSNTQKQFFNRFREGIFNLLVVTRVAEEGIDIPACNLVIIFDIFRSNTGYIQSRGRARDVLGSEYYVFVQENDEHVIQTLAHAKISEALTRTAIKAMAEQETT
ncbi:P-loop containing nucleoside triphosphate hydrolase protein [Chytridium lagenaria]|nr:P-loop containing nucleoside triphosphate hydrolase protein [Chytridium lagenaria]